MKEYEKISENCKILWKENFELTTEKYTQVSGYIFNDGEVVYISDFREIPEESLKLIKVKPEILIMPLTTPKGTRFHASLEDLLGYAERIEPKRMIINHMAVESDYAEVYSHCPRGIEPAYDGMEVCW